MLSLLHVRLLGEFQVLVDQLPATTLHAPRLQSLLAYLILHRNAPQPREHLAFLLWPDSSEIQARTNLRNLIHQLRHTAPFLEQYLLIDSTTICWRSTGALHLDVAEFEQAIALADHAKRSGLADAANAALHEAAGLYRGELLPGCYDEWILPIRERLHQQFIAALENLLTLAEAQRSYHEAIQHARLLLQFEPLHETVYLALMRLQALNGDRAAALHTYQTCSTLLEREFGAEPDRPLREAYARLTRLDSPLPPIGARQAPSLVGRHHAWTRLVSIWAEVAGGRPQAVILSGEAGIGKTRLAEELLRWAELQGFWTARACCYASEGDLPYAPVVAWLKSKPLAEALTLIEPAWARELGHLVPELVAGRSDLPPAQPSSEPWQRQHLFEALTQATSATSHPLLLLLDDLQWCDRCTLEWLHYRLRHETGGCLLLVATLRPDDIEPGSRSAALLHDLQAQSLVSEIALAPLGEAETADLAAQICRAPLTAAQAATLYHETEGNPLFVIELARAELVECLPASRAVGAIESSHGAPRLPPRLCGVIGARLAKLSPPAYELAGLAATIGRAFTLRLLAGASPAQEEDRLVQALDELWHRRIIREQSGQSYDFSHNKLREVIYGQLSIARRQLLHRRVAQAYEALCSERDALISAQIAAHYEHAGCVREAVCLYQRAAAAAQQVYTNVEAQTYVEQALSLVESVPAAELTSLDAARLTVELREQLGELLALAGAYPEAEHAFQLALAASPAGDYFCQVRLCCVLGNVVRAQHRYDEAEQAYLRGEALLKSVPHATDRSWWQNWLCLQLERLENSLTGEFTGHPPDIPTAQLEGALEHYGTPQQRARFLQIALMRTIGLSNFMPEEVEYEPHLKALLIASDASGDRPTTA